MAMQTSSLLQELRARDQLFFESTKTQKKQISILFSKDSKEKVLVLLYSVSLYQVFYRSPIRSPPTEEEGASPLRNPPTEEGASPLRNPRTKWGIHPFTHTHTHTKGNSTVFISKSPRTIFGHARDQNKKDFRIFWFLNFLLFYFLSIQKKGWSLTRNSQRRELVYIAILVFPIIG